MIGAYFTVVIYTSLFHNHQVCVIITLSYPLSLQPTQIEDKITVLVNFVSINKCFRVLAWRSADVQNANHPSNDHRFRLNSFSCMARKDNNKMVESIPAVKICANKVFIAIIKRVSVDFIMERYFCAKLLLIINKAGAVICFNL